MLLSTHVPKFQVKYKILTPFCIRSKGIQFRTTHLRNNDKSFRCSGLTRSGAANQRFKVEDDRGNSRETTVADYYAKEYKIRLKYPDMPCLLVGNLKSGHAKFFPLELMKVAPRQRSPGKNDEMVTSNLIRQGHSRRCF